MHVVGETEGPRLRRTAEPRPAGRGDKRLRVHAYNYIGAHGSARRSMSWGKRTPINRASIWWRIEGSSVRALAVSSRREGLLLRASHRTGYAGHASGSLDRCIRTPKRAVLNPPRGSTVQATALAVILRFALCSR